MSYQQGGQYGQQPNHSYYNSNPPYGQQPPPNDGQQGQYGQQPYYPGQPTYTQYPPYSAGGGPVQQPHAGYQEGYTPQAQPSNPAYPGQQQYQYNPQHYAPPQPQPPPTPQYNPQNYPMRTQSTYSPQTYNPQHYSPATPYSEQGSFAGATSGPVDPYAYPESPYSPQPQTYGQSPHRPSFSPVPSYSPQVPSHGYGYQPPQQSPPPAHQYGGFAPPASTASQAQQIPYPTTDYRSHPPGMNARQPSQHYHQPASVFAGAADEYMPSPPSHDQSPSPLYHTTSGASLPSPPTTGPTPPSHAPSRMGTLGRHPQSRPLPGPPDPNAGSDYFPHHRDERRDLSVNTLSLEEQERLTQEDLFQQVESAVYNAGRTGGHSPAISVSQPPLDVGTTPLFPPNSPNVHRSGSVVNGHLSPAPPETQYSSDSDAEASAGLAMLAMAEEDDRRRQSSGSQIRFSTGYGSQRSSRQQHLMPQPEASDSDDYGGVDMSTFGGGYDVHMTYGGDPSTLAAGGDANGQDAYGQPVSSQHSSLRSMRRSNPSQSSQASHDYDYRTGAYNPFMPFNPEARVDAPGTGGLSQPSADGRRQSFDEGDEDIFSDGHRFPDEPPDIFYQPSSTSYRPLPAVPGAPAPPALQTDFRQAQDGVPYPSGPDTFYNNYQQSQYVPRSTSLVSHTTTPAVHQPSRSKTDAEERRLRAQPHRLPVPQLSTVSSTTSLTPAVDLPTIPGKRFVPSQLGAPAFNKCEEPWSLSSILTWLLEITNPEAATEIREAEIKDALVALFTNKVPTMNIADAETLSNRVVQDMYQAETLMATEEWVKIMPGQMQGVIFQLTGTGCYAPMLHDYINPGRCYSHHCQRTLKKVNLREQPVRTGESWAEFYKLNKEDYEGKDKRELERQNVLHEVVQTEDGFIDQLNVLRVLYRDPLAKVEPSIIAPKRKDKFLMDVFGKVDAVKQANVDHLLPQLKYRQQEQGPYIVGFSDIFRQWIRKAKAAYIEYAASFPAATFMVRQEIERNIEFRNFIDKARNDKRSVKLGWDTFLKAPITRLQRYTLLLNTVLKTMKTDSEEKANLKIAFDEVKAVTMECDARVAETQRKVDLNDLGYKLALRSNLKQKIELNLDHFGREMIHRGDVQRMGDSRFTWIDSHVILFDHYLVIAKTVTHRTEQQGKREIYDVSRLPIPMDLLILDSANDPPVQKSSYVKGLTRDVTGRGTPGDPAGLGRTPSSQNVNPQLAHTNTGASNNSLQTVTSLGDGKDADRIIYPFRVKHLGRDTYTLFAPTEQARREWANKIIEAKTKHAAALHRINSEPFRLRVMADSAFVYDPFAGTGNKSYVIKGTPVDRAIKEVEQRFKDSGRPGPICRARVNCATTFTTAPDPVKELPGKEMVAVGTDYGVYISETDNPRGWTKAVPMAKVTQVSVLEEFNLFLLISDKTLLAYPLDVVCPSGTSSANGPTATSNSDSTAKAPKKLSGSKDVGFFVAGRMKDRTLVFYKKRESLNSVFKVIEPIYSKSAEKRRGMFKSRGPTDFFREYDEFYIPAECNALNLFHSSLAVSTARGFEVLTLDKKVPHTVPDLRAQEVQDIASHIKDQRALAMLRLSEQEYLLVYANCAVYINKHGEVSRSVILEFVGFAQSAALYGAYLLLFCDDFVEIRNALNGRLMQVIAGREIKCLDDGGSWSSAAANAAAAANGAAQGGANGANGYANAGAPAVGGRTVKLVMQHPESERTQVVVELLLKGSVRE